jgi:integrase
MPPVSGHSGTRDPRYCKQKGIDRPDRAYVRIDGKKINLGRYGTPESYERYAELIKALRGETPPPQAPEPPQEPHDLTISELLVQYLAYAVEYYQAGSGKKTEVDDLKHVLRTLRRLEGATLAKDFGPLKLKAVRQAFIEMNHSRAYINKNVDRIRRVFKWAAADELIPASVPQALSMVAGLKRGRTAAREPDPIQPVPDDVIEATLPFLPDVIADMVRIQRLTGMRGGEVVQLRPCDLDRSADVWVFRPATHKTQYRGRERVVFIGPKGQEILLRYLVRDSQTYCFRPVDSEEKRLAELHRNRKTPLSCGNVPDSNRVENRKKQPGEAYTSNSYRRAIHRACDKAFPAPKSLKGKALAEWQSSHRWCPHQLRHAAATEVRKNFGLEAAQIVLGHSAADVTQIYAERDLAKGLEVAKLIG